MNPLEFAWPSSPSRSSLPRDGKVLRLLMKAALMLAIFSCLGFAQAPATGDTATENTCVSCHLALGDEMAAPVDPVLKDVHGRRGLMCESCHGGNSRETDPDRSMDPKVGFVGKPSPAQIPAFCGKCHSNATFMRQFNPSLRVDQQSEYATSVHGKRLVQGDMNVATCVSCHGNHGVIAVKDPNSPVYATHVATTCSKCHSDSAKMQPYGIPVDQASKYSRSVHAEALLRKQDLSAPTCNDCHGNHGAAPPESASVENVCGTCHGRQAELFDKGAHKDAFDLLGIPQCLACHGNHDIRHPSDILISIAPRSACRTCHEQGEPGYEAADQMYHLLSSLDNAIADSKMLLDQAARAGMEVSDGLFRLNDARDKLINARVVVHSFSTDTLREAIAPGVMVAEEARQGGVDALAELQFRRKWLVVSLGVIAIAVLSVYLKIREIERPLSGVESNKEKMEDQ